MVSSIEITRLTVNRLSFRVKVRRKVIDNVLYVKMDQVRQLARLSVRGRFGNMWTNDNRVFKGRQGNREKANSGYLSY